MNDLILFGDSALTVPADPVTEFDSDLLNEILLMFDIMTDAKGMGLAANQIGINKRMFTWNIGAGYCALINPEIVEAEGIVNSTEGCLSIPGFQFDIERSHRLTVRGQSVHGDELIFDDDALLSIVFQHEIDHLDGILLTDRLPRDVRRQVLEVIGKVIG